MSKHTTPVIWIVDDDEDDQYLFEIAFRRLTPPIAVKLLSDGEELLPALAQSSVLPNLIILDLNMPRLNGFQTLKQLRAVATYEDLPVILLTTSSRSEDQDMAARLGANGFLTKPPSMDTILVLFRHLVQEWKLA